MLVQTEVATLARHYARQNFAQSAWLITALVAAYACGGTPTGSSQVPVRTPVVVTGAGGSTSSSAGVTGAAGVAGQLANAISGHGGSVSLGSSGVGAQPIAGIAGQGVAAGSGTAGASDVTASAAGGGSGGAIAGTGGLGGTGGSASDACPMPMVGSHGTNPLFSDQYTADPGALVYRCKFYIQCGHDEGETGFVMKEWFLLSSSDMVHWTKKVALDLTAFKWADANAWAGQMVTKNGKFYWFVPVEERGSGMAIGIAVADDPNGPWKDALGKPLIDDAFEMSNMGFKTPSDTAFTIDPTVFVDDDGQAYLHYGGFGRMIEARLSDDMLSVQGKMQEVSPQGFFEAAYLLKHDGKYYEIYAAGSNPATIDYSTSASPLGPWKYGGRVLDALPGVPGQDAPTNHSAVAELAGQWYIVYHLSNGPNNGGTYKREVAVDKLTFNSDGTIKKVTPSSGLAF